MEKTKCPNCGETSRIRERDKFCHKCGCNLKTGELRALEKTTEITIHKIDSRSFLQVGSELIEISDYNVKSSANGITELNVTISGNSNVFELLTNLEEAAEIEPVG